MMHHIYIHLLLLLQFQLTINTIKSNNAQVRIIGVSSYNHNELLYYYYYRQ